jgi:hypothetical protein
MSYDEKQYLADHQDTFNGFMKLTLYGSVATIIVLALMALFLL